MNQEDLEGKVCPIDGTSLKIENNGGWKYVYCKKCNANYCDSDKITIETLSEEYLIEKAKQYLKFLEKWNGADRETIKNREEILCYGEDKGLI